MMLRVSTKGEYGVRIMVDLARHYGQRPRSLTDISQAEMLTTRIPGAVVKLLREARTSTGCQYTWCTRWLQAEPRSRLNYDG